MINLRMTYKFLLLIIVTLSLTLAPTAFARQRGAATDSAKEARPAGTADVAYTSTTSGTGAQEDEEKSPADQMKLPEKPAFLDRVERRVSGSPRKLDAALRDAGVAARLMNFNLASEQDLTAVGLGKVLFIPIQVTDRPGGRSSVYFLPRGKETLTGVYVNGTGLALHYVKRLSGRDVAARAGDKYSMRVTNLEGALLFRGDGTLESFDARAGKGRIKYEVKSGAGATSKTITVEISVIWSCFKKTTTTTE